jgi:hypothetical protein
MHTTHHATTRPQGAVDALTDWAITAQPPLTLRNDLPVAAFYALWERPARGGSLVLRQQGRLEGSAAINVYAVDMRQQVCVCVCVCARACVERLGLGMQLLRSRLGWRPSASLSLVCAAVRACPCVTHRSA